MPKDGDKRYRERGGRMMSNRRSGMSCCVAIYEATW